MRQVELTADLIDDIDELFHVETFEELMDVMNQTGLPVSYTPGKLMFGISDYANRRMYIGTYELLTENSHKLQTIWLYMPKDAEPPTPQVEDEWAGFENITIK